MKLRVYLLVCVVIATLVMTVFIATTIEGASQSEKATQLSLLAAFLPLAVTLASLILQEAVTCLVAKRWGFTIVSVRLFCVEFYRVKAPRCSVVSKYQRIIRLF